MFEDDFSFPKERDMLVLWRVVNSFEIPIWRMDSPHWKVVHRYLVFFSVWEPPYVEKGRFGAQQNLTQYLL